MQKGNLEQRTRSHPKGFLFFLTYFILITSKFGRNGETLGAKVTRVWNKIVPYQVTQPLSQLRGFLIPNISGRLGYLFSIRSSLLRFHERSSRTRLWRRLCKLLIIRRRASPSPIMTNAYDYRRNRGIECSIELLSCNLFFKSSNLFPTKEWINPISLISLQFKIYFINRSIPHVNRLSSIYSQFEILFYRNVFRVS